MKKRAVFYLFIGILMVLLINPFVFARTGSVFEPLDDLFIGVIPNRDLSSPSVRDNPSLWIFITFTIVYGIIYAATERVTILKEAKGARVMMSIAFAVMSVIVPGLMRLLAGLSPIFLMIVVPVILFFIVKTAWSDFGAGATEASTRSAETKLAYQKADSAYQKELKDLDKEKQKERDEENALRKLQNIAKLTGRAVGEELQLMKDVKKKIEEAQNALRASRSDVAKEDAKAVFKDLVNLIKDIQRVAKLNTDFQAWKNRLNQISQDMYTGANTINDDIDVVNKIIAKNSATITGAVITPGTRANIFRSKMRGTIPVTDMAMAGIDGATYAKKLLNLIKKERAELAKVNGFRTRLRTEENKYNTIIGNIRTQLRGGNIGSISLSDIDTAIALLEEMGKINLDIEAMYQELQKIQADKEIVIRKIKDDVIAALP
ncbi:MAG: hypothetical protein V1740_06980 [Candidatus Woesearchaeota archaeon]